MARKGPTISEVIRGIVRGSPEPLTLEQIAAGLATAAPGLSKDPAKSVKAFLSNHRNGCVFKLPDGCVGWKPRLISGATHRLTIEEEEDLSERELILDDAVRDLLYPALFDTQKDEGSDLLTLALEGGPTVDGKVSHVGGGMWQAELPPPFWEWLAASGAEAEDHLIVTAVDGEARRYAARLEHAADYDDMAVAERNDAVMSAAEAFVERRGGRFTTWELISYLNVTGAFHNPVPPAPFPVLWEDEDIPFDLDELDLDLLSPGSITIPEGLDLQEAERRLAAMLSSPTPPKLAPDDPLLPLLNQLAEKIGLPGLALGPGGALELDEDEDDEDEHPPDLNPAYYPSGKRRKAQPSPQGKRGPVKTYVLRVSHHEYPDTWRDIEIAEDQNFEDLHLAIQQAFGWDDDHLYSFFTGKKPFDPKHEISAPWAESSPHTHQVTLGSLGLKAKRKLYYLFDYGDEHLFELLVTAVNPQAPKGSYPKVVGRHGRAPSQYSEEWF